MNPPGECTGQFSEAGLHEEMPSVIFRARSQNNAVANFWPIPEKALLHAVYNSGR